MPLKIMLWWENMNPTDLTLFLVKDAFQHITFYLLFRGIITLPIVRIFFTFSFKLSDWF